MIDEKKLLSDIEKEMNTAITMNLLQKVAGIHRIKRIVQSQPEVNRWIPVSERLPEEDFKYFNVTIKLPSGNDIVEYCLYKQSERKFYIVADGNLELNQAWEEEAAGVIAWQPLPEPYKEG